MLEKYNYVLPRNKIALKPAEPRDRAKLLIYERKTGKVSHAYFYELANYLPKNSLLIINKTRVYPARLILKKTSGGQIRILIINKSKNRLLVLAERKVDCGERLYLNKEIYFEVCDKINNQYLLKPNLPLKEINKTLFKYGKTPLPPYLKNSPLSEKQRRNKYQTIFAKEIGSIAAPTAALHFTPRLLNNLKNNNVHVAELVLHVNLGTFAPVTEKQIKTGKLHAESYEISPKIIAQIKAARKQKRPVIAVGTTTVRALETYAQKNKLRGKTTIFIKSGYKFKLIDGLITNFHVPRSSLMVLVAALIGQKSLIRLYKTALKNNYRFLSFGDAMLII